MRSNILYNTPEYYARLSAYAYCDNVRYIGQYFPNVQFLELFEYKNWRMFIVKNLKTDQLEVIFRGTEMCVGNVLNDIQHQFSIKSKAFKTLEYMLEVWAKKYGKIACFIGHSAGGYFASRLKGSWYCVNRITFNAHKAIRGDRTINIRNDGDWFVSKVLSVADRYINIGPGGHGIKRVIENLVGKSWNDILKDNKKSIQLGEDMLTSQQINVVIPLSNIHAPNDNLEILQQNINVHNDNLEIVQQNNYEHATLGDLEISTSDKICTELIDCAKNGVITFISSLVFSLIITLCNKEKKNLLKKFLSKPALKGLCATVITGVFKILDFVSYYVIKTSITPFISFGLLSIRFIDFLNMCDLQTKYICNNCNHITISKTLGYIFDVKKYRPFFWEDNCENCHQISYYRRLDKIKGDITKYVSAEDSMRFYYCSDCGYRELRWWWEFIVGLPEVVKIKWYEGSCKGCKKDTKYIRHDLVMKKIKMIH